MFSGYGYENVVKLVDGDALDTFTTLVGYTSASEMVDMLQTLDVSTDKIKGLVCAHALAEVGLD